MVHKIVATRSNAKSTKKRVHTSKATQREHESLKSSKVYFRVARVARVERVPPREAEREGAELDGRLELATGRGRAEVDGPASTTSSESSSPSDGTDTGCRGGKT